MSSISKKKRKRTTPYTEEALQMALTEIRVNKRAVSAVCKEFKIPKTTVLDRISGRTTDSLKKPGPDPVLGIEGEAKVVDWLLSIAKCGFPVKKQELLDVIQKIVRDGDIKNNFKNERPGNKWFKQFLERNKEISVKSAEGINKARAQVTEESIRLWFRELKQYLDSVGQSDILDSPERIFNGDESGFCLCPKTGKVLGPKGYRNLYQIKQGNEKENITVLLTFNANGDLCPPCVVYPYIRPPKTVVNSMPPDWCLGKSETGWMRGDVFFEYITNDFNNWVIQNNIKKPILLLVDGHKSHMSFMLSSLCEEMQIILYALPPNTTHILQPADVSVFAPVKTHWKNTVRNFLSKPENVNSAVTKTNFCTLLSETLKYPSMPEHIRNGFKRCGLYPFDSDAPDYTKCVRNTLENMAIDSRQPNANINHADIVSTKKILKHLKPTLKKKKINVRVIIKELNILKKSLPIENNQFNPEISIDTGSETNESSIIDTSCLEISTDITNNKRSIECEIDATTEITISSLKDHDEEHNKEDLQRTNASHDSGAYLVTETVSAMIHSSPKKTKDLLSIPSTSIKEKRRENSTPVGYDNFDEISYYETTQDTFIADSQKESTLPLDSIPIFNSEENIETISTLHLSGSYLDIGSVVSLDDILILPFHDVLCPSQTAEASTPMAEPLISGSTPDPVTNVRTLSTPFSPLTTISSESPPTKTTIASPSEPSNNSLHAFKHHLMLPELLEKSNKKKQRTPAAISSAAWRKYYEEKEKIEMDKKESTRKRKLERIEKQQNDRLLKENAKANKAPPKRKRNSVKSALKQQLNEACKENVPSLSKIKCSECDSTLISDVEDDDDKNVGCDECIRWYHLKCTQFAGQEYLQIKDKPFKCNLCD